MITAWVCVVVTSHAQVPTRRLDCDSMPPKRATFTELIVGPSKNAPRDKFLDLLDRAKIACMTRLETTGDCLVQYESSKEPNLQRAIERLRGNIHALAPAAFDQADQRLVGDIFVNEPIEIEDDQDEGELVWPTTILPQAVNDPKFSEQVQLGPLNAVLAWDGVDKRQRVVVAVLDEGVQLDHPDLEDNLERGISFGCDPQQSECNGAPTKPTKQHGTKIAGLIGAVVNNRIGIAGAAWKPRVIPINIGVRGGSDITAACGVEFAARSGATVINASWWDDRPLKELAKVLRAQDSRVVFVAAAGSGGKEINGAYPSYPLLEGLENVFGVAAHNDLFVPLKGSNRSKTYVHIAAPAYTFTTHICQRGVKCYGKAFGNTSYSTAYASSIVGLLKSRYPNWNAEWLKWRITSNAIPSQKLRDMSSSGGRLDLGLTMFPITTTPAKIDRADDTIIEWKNGIREDMCPDVSVSARVGEPGNMGMYSLVIPSTQNDGAETLSANKSPRDAGAKIQFRVKCANGKADAESPPIDLAN
jgi:hypothetical protein